MMSLDLNQKARKFKLEFDEYAMNNMLEQSLDGNAWNEAYETQIKAFYEKENLDLMQKLPHYLFTKYKIELLVYL